MPVKWEKTRFPGVRYYEHPDRKHGIGKDRYFAIRYQRSGKRTEEGLGWSSEGWTAEKAVLELAELKTVSTLERFMASRKKKKDNVVPLNRGA